VLITFRNAKWFGVFHDEGTPISIEASRIKAVLIQDKSVMVNVDDGRDASLLVVACDSQEAALAEQARIVDDVNGKPPQKPEEPTTPSQEIIAEANDLPRGTITRLMKSISEAFGGADITHMMVPTGAAVTVDGVSIGVVPHEMLHDHNPEQLGPVVASMLLKAATQSPRREQ
jgi:hypothetical protein